MAEPINIGGVFYEPVGNGKMKVVGYADAPAGASGRVFSLPPSAKDVREQQRQAAADARSAAADARAAEAARREQLDWNAKHNPDGTPKDPEAPSLPADQLAVTGDAFLKKLSPPDAAQVKALASGRMAFPTGRAASSPYWQTRLQQVAQYDPQFDAINYNARAKTRADFTSGVSARNIKALNTAIGHVGTLASQIDGTASHGGFPLATTVNSLENAYSRSKGDPGITNYAQTAGAVSGELTQVFRGSGGAEADIQRYLNELDPNASAAQKKAAVANILALLKSRLDALDDQYTKGMGTAAHGLQVLDPHAIETLQQHLPGFNAAEYGGGDGGQPPSDNGGPSDGGGTPPTSGSGGDGTITPTNGQQRSTYDPRASSQIDALMNAGASLGTINAVLKRQNLNAITPASYAAAKQWMQKNPGQKYFGSNLSRTEDLNVGQRVLANPVIAPIATGAVRAGDAASAGLLGAISGEEGRGAMEAMGDLHPDAAILGDTAGGIAGALGGEELAIKGLTRIPAALKYAPAIGDMLYGSLLGYNRAAPGQGGVGAAEGAAGGLAGNLLMKGAGSALRGVADPAAQFLRSKGVPLTVGQTLANSGRLGATAKGIEDAMTSIPGVGSVIKARQREGLEGFNGAAFQDLPGHSGATGAAGVREGGQLVDNAYNFLDSTNLPLDAPYAGTEATIRATAPSRFAPDINDQLDQTASRVVNGALPGRDWQSAIRANRANRSSVAGQPYADPAVAAHNDIEQNLIGLAQRQGPPDTTDNLDAANLLYSRYQTLAKALDNGPAQQADELFTPARLDAAARQSANQFQGRAQSVMGNRPFYDLTKAGRSVLPSTIPDSGTATRGLVAMGLTGAAGAGAGTGVGALAGDPKSGAETGLGLTLLLAAGGSKPAQRAMVKALADRPDLLRNAGNLIYDKGWVGSGVLAPLLTGP